MAPLIQFKAGRAQRRAPDSNWVDPLPGRGLVYLEEDDGLMHFYYKDLDANAVVEDLIIFPGDVTFVRASERVHCLKFSSSSARLFFWHQDVDSSQDDVRAQRMNELMNGGDDDGDEHGMDVEGGGDDDPVEVDTAMEQDSGPDDAATSDQLATLQDILRGFSQQRASSSQSFALTDILTPSNLRRPMLAAHFDALAEHLPSGVPRTLDTLERVVASPEFRRSVSSLDRALPTGALGPLTTALGLDESAAMGTTEFVEAIQRQADREKQQQQQQREEGGDEQES